MKFVTKSCPVFRALLLIICHVCIYDCFTLLFCDSVRLYLLMLLMSFKHLVSAVVTHWLSDTKVDGSNLPSSQV